MTLNKLEQILNSGPSLEDNKQWNAVEHEFCKKDLPSITAKLEIGQHDLYLKTAWWRGSIVKVDITLSRGREPEDGSSKNPKKSAKQISLETTRFDLARSWVESECRLASMLLQSGTVGIGAILDRWSGVEGYPTGYCRQLKAVNASTGESGPTFQKGPLHAAAMLIGRRLVDWHEEMENYD